MTKETNGSVSPRTLVSTVSILLTIVVTSVGAAGFVMNKINCIERQLEKMQLQINATVSSHIAGDWTLRQQRIYNRILATGNPNLVTPDIDSIVDTN